MTYQECKEMVSRPGKFEGCPVYAPYFHDLIMDGGGDSSYYDEYERCHDIFKLDPSDTTLFPELAKVYAVDCFTDDNGFFYCSPVTEEEANQSMEEAYDNDERE